MLAGVQHQVERGPGSTTCFWSRRQGYIAGVGSSEEKHSFYLILHTENNRGWFCTSCGTRTSAATVCHWSQGVFTQQRVFVAARSIGKVSVHRFDFALAKKHRSSGLGGTCSKESFNVPFSPQGKINPLLSFRTNLVKLLSKAHSSGDSITFVSRISAYHCLDY